jgi:hypothetical protein
MSITIPPDIQIAGIIVAIVFIAVAGGWIYLKSRGSE